MSEPHDMNNSTDDLFEARLRAMSAVPARLDRDRLMHLAGQRSATPQRRARLFWPALTCTSWAACAAIAVYAATRPPQVVTQVRIVERVVEAPSVPPPAPARRLEPSMIAKRPSVPGESSLVPANVSDFHFLDDLRRPLTALASRPSLFAKSPETAVAAVDSPPAEMTTPPKSQLDLRREMLGSEPVPRIDRLWWF